MLPKASNEKFVSKIGLHFVNIMSLYYKNVITPLIIIITEWIELIGYGEGE